MITYFTTNYCKLFYALFLSYLFCPLILTAQILFRESNSNFYFLESKAIQSGRAEQYLTTRFSHFWLESLIENRNDLLTTNIGDGRLRENRLKLYPYFSVDASINGGSIQEDGSYVDRAPAVFIVANYKGFPFAKYRITFWMNFESHRLLSTKTIANFGHDFDSHKEVGYSSSVESDKWKEYDIGDGGIVINYPAGEVALVKSNPIWGPGYAGQLLFSNKSPSFSFIQVHHRISDKWNFTFLHGFLNSTYEDLTYKYLGVPGLSSPGFPRVRKYVAAHRLDLHIKESFRLGFGESVIYGARGIELGYLLAVVPYWSIQHDLSDPDNVQWFADFDIVMKNVGRLYGAFFLDEWHLSKTFDKDKSRNWFAYQVGASYRLPVVKSGGTTLRAEYTFLTPYVYVHRNRINTFEHWGHPLGFWTGPNSDNLFLAVEGSLMNGLWLQFYGQHSRRGEVSDSTVVLQYQTKHIPFLDHPTYEGEAENKTLFGVRGEARFANFVIVEFDIFHVLWQQKVNLNQEPTDENSPERYTLRKWYGRLKISIGI